VFKLFERDEAAPQILKASTDRLHGLFNLLLPPHLLLGGFILFQRQHIPATNIVTLLRANKGRGGGQKHNIVNQQHNNTKSAAKRLHLLHLSDATAAGARLAPATCAQGRRLQATTSS
jgi:hypothetical protein